MIGWMREIGKAVPGRRSSGWRLTRKGYLIFFPKCQSCNTKSNLQVHHVCPVHTHPELELDSSNLVTLCGRCHFIIGHLGSWSSWNKDVLWHASLLLKEVLKRP